MYNELSFCLESLGVSILLEDLSQRMKFAILGLLIGADLIGSIL